MCLKNINNITIINMSTYTERFHQIFDEYIIKNKSLYGTCVAFDSFYGINIKDCNLNIDNIINNNVDYVKNHNKVDASYNSLLDKYTKERLKYYEEGCISSKCISTKLNMNQGKIYKNEEDKKKDIIKQARELEDEFNKRISIYKDSTNNKCVVTNNKQNNIQNIKSYAKELEEQLKKLVSERNENDTIQTKHLSDFIYMAYQDCN